MYLRYMTPIDTLTISNRHHRSIAAADDDTSEGDVLWAGYKSTAAKPQSRVTTMSCRVQRSVTWTVQNLCYPPPTTLSTPTNK